MFNELIDDAAQRVCTACERVRRLDGMVAREARSTSGRSAGETVRLADTYANIERLATGDLSAATAVLLDAGNMLSKNVLGGIDAGRASRAVSASRSGVMSMSGWVPNIIQDAAEILGSASPSPGIGTSLSQAVGSVGGVLGRVSQSITAAFGGAALLPPEIELTALNAGYLSAAPATSSFSNAHLLILVTMDTPAESFYFNLTTAGYDSLRRQTRYNIASQDRLTRRPALQAVSKGAESITVSGAIFTKTAGGKHMNRLRDIGFRMAPLMLTTGYGEALGQWYLANIDEDQEALFPDGVPRKQTFNLEFQRYGEDYQDI